MILLRLSLGGLGEIVHLDGIKFLLLPFHFLFKLVDSYTQDVEVLEAGMWVNFVDERGAILLVDRVLLDARQGSFCTGVGFLLFGFPAYQKELQHEHVIVEVLRFH